MFYCAFNRVKDEAGISSWDWTLNGQSSTYHALFPRAWTIYEGELPIIIMFLLFEKIPYTCYKNLILLDLDSIKIKLSVNSPG